MHARVLSLALVFSSIAAYAQQQTLTAEQVIAKMCDAAHITVAVDTVDSVKAGDPATVVSGIATTIWPTMDVLRKAVAAGDNLIVTHEPSFYNHLDATNLYPSDAVVAEKLKYIADHKLVLFRWHDGAHGRQPDFIMEGWKAKAGWATAHRNPGEPMLYTSAPVTIAALAAQLKKATGAQAVRVVGDPKLTVTKLAYAPGAPGAARQIKTLERDDVEVLVAGEIPEWETIAYAEDASQQGRHKALILMGHYTSEEPGMQTVADWLKSVVPGMKVDFIPAGEPYWLASPKP